MTHSGDIIYIIYIYGRKACQVRHAFRFGGKGDFV
jgi:hypothetical protein